MPYTQLYYHLIWATKYRTPFLEDDEIERFVQSQLRRKAEGLGVRVFAVDGWMDHVHMVVMIPPKIAVADLIGQVKGAASTMTNKSGLLDERFAWQREYAAFSFDRKSLASHIAYVERQKEHHRRGTTIRVLEPRADETDEVRENQALYIVEDHDWRRSLEAMED